MGIPTSQYLAQKEAFSTKTVSEIREARGQQLTNREKNLHFLEIDGQKIGGYGAYSFYIQKTYAKEPTRSSSGSIDNLDSYSTFLTPTVKIKFNALSLEQYQKIIKIIHSKNEHLVKCYDIVYDTIREFNAYFAPDDYPELFIYDFELIGVINYEIELIGTNTSLNKCSITYHINDPSGTLTTTVGSPDYNMGQEVIMGKSAGDVKTLEGYTFFAWNTEPDRSGEWYSDGVAYYLNKDLLLYAQWLGGQTYTLSYNYGEGVIAKNQNDEDITSKTIVKGSAITFTSTMPNPVEYHGVEYNPYETPSKWYWQPQRTATADEIKNGETIYNIDGNSTIYQHFDRKNYSVVFDLGPSGNKITVTGRYGSEISIPDFETANANAWKIMKIEDEAVHAENLYFEGTTMPPVNIEVRATHK